MAEHLFWMHDHSRLYIEVNHDLVQINPVDVVKNSKLCYRESRWEHRGCFEIVSSPEVSFANIDTFPLDAAGDGVQTNGESVQTIDAVAKCLDQARLNFPNSISNPDSLHLVLYDGGKCAYGRWADIRESFGKRVNGEENGMCNTKIIGDADRSVADLFEVLPARDAELAINSGTSGYSSQQSFSMPVASAEILFLDSEHTFEDATSWRVYLRDETERYSQMQQSAILTHILTELKIEKCLGQCAQLEVGIDFYNPAPWSRARQNRLTLKSSA